MEELRKVEVYVHPDGWIAVPFRDVKKGDFFRIFESTGEPVYDQLHNSEFTATSDAKEIDGVGCIISDGTFI